MRFGAGTVASSVLALALVAAPAASAADPCSNAPVRTGRSADLPDCRAYEQVSPADKLGYFVQSFQGPRPGWASRNGTNMLYNVSGPATPDAAHGVPFPLVSQRTANGWATHQAVNGPVPNAPINALHLVLSFQIPTADRTGLAFSSRLPFTADNPSGMASGQPEGPDSFFSANLARGSRIDWISKPVSGPPQPVEPSMSHMRPVGGSDDLSTTYFQTDAVLTDQERAIGRQNQELYRWKDGVLTPAGVLPDGSLDPEGAVLPNYDLAGSLTSQEGILVAYGNTVADDGKMVLFVSPAGASSLRPKQLYLARDGQPTIQLSKPVNAAGSVASTVGLGETGAISGAGFAPMLAAMSEDGQHVWFSTGDQLTSAAPADPAFIKAYRYDVAAGTLSYLPEVIHSGAQYGWLYRTSYDGSHALFASDTGDLEISRIGQPPVTVAPDFFDPGGGLRTVIDARFSRDGKVLVLSSGVPLRGETGHPDGTVQIYRYTESDDQLVCISCGPADAAPQGNGSISNWTQTGGTGSRNSTEAMIDSRALSDDGRTVFFDTTWPLLPTDHNVVSDVYQWRDGVLSLISAGAAPERAGTVGANVGGSFFVDSSASGDDVFFTSLTGLVGADRDGAYDLYDARVGGGFAERAPETPCTGEYCRLPASVPPGAPVAGSIAFAGAGNLLATPAKARSATVTVSGLKAVTGSVATVKVRVPAAGAITVSGTAVRRATRSARKAASYTMRVALTARSKRSLAKHTRLKVKVKVSFKPKVGAAAQRTVTLSFKSVRKAR